jgi:hypothetical protein
VTAGGRGRGGRGDMTRGGQRADGTGRGRGMTNGGRGASAGQVSHSPCVLPLPRYTYAVHCGLLCMAWKAVRFPF